MIWHLKDRGFLPDQDPLERIQDSDFRYVERLAAKLPQLVSVGEFQEYSEDILTTKLNLTDFIECGNDIERAFMLFSYLASAYIHSSTKTAIPKCIARPLVRLAKAVQRPPILSYASYCLHNWRRIDKNKPIELGNIELLQNFSLEAKKDEDWFILVHVDIEAKANDALNAITMSYPTNKNLIKLHDSLVGMNKTLARMPEQCSPEVYFAKVRPYIFGFNGIVYEGCFDNQPQTFRGETGAQSTIIPAILVALGIKHKDSMLTQHLSDMRNYMPKEHINFLDEIHNIRWWVDDTLKEIYNSCVEQVIVFRKQHFEYAVNYIEKRVDNPAGTGGTPYVKWLGQLIEETKEFLL